MVKSTILSSGSERGARGGLVLASPSRGESAIKLKMQPSITLIVALCPRRVVERRSREVVCLLSGGGTADVADSEQLYIMYGG